MNSANHIKEMLSTTREHLSYGEIQLAIGEFSITAAGISLAFVGVEAGSILDLMIGGVVGFRAYEIGAKHWKEGREKIKRRRARQAE